MSSISRNKLFLLGLINAYALVKPLFFFRERERERETQGYY